MGAAPTLAMIASAIGCGRGSSGTTPTAGPTPNGLANLHHIIIVIQENHSFDTYYGVRWRA
jgi:phospholipase C